MAGIILDTLADVTALLAMNTTTDAPTLAGYGHCGCLYSVNTSYYYDPMFIKLVFTPLAGSAAEFMRSQVHGNYSLRAL